METEKEIPDDITDMVDSKKRSFFNYVFSLSSSDKAELYNILQYSVFAVPLIILLNKVIHSFMPKEDENKGLLEILLEIFAEIVLLYLGIFFIDRIISYFSTISKTNYKKINLLTTVVPFLLTLLSLQTQIGLKGSHVYHKLFDVIDGKVNLKDKSVVKVSQPLSKNHTANNLARMNPNIENNRAAMPNVNVTMPTQPTQSMNVSSGGVSGQPMVQQPQMESPLLAANEALGGSFGSAF